MALKTAEEKRKSQLALVDEHGVSIDEGIRSGRGWSHGGLPHPRRVGNEDSDDDESGACEGKRGGGVTPGSSLLPSRMVWRNRLSSDEADDEEEEEEEDTDDGELDFIDDDEDPEDRDMRLAIQVMCIQTTRITLSLSSYDTCTLSHRCDMM